PRIAVLPDAARVEERLGDLARQRDFVPFRIAFSVAELGRELIREAQRAGSCPEVASRFAVQLALRQAARDHSPGPYFAVRNHAGYADRKSTRLNSSHVKISYAVFCLKKKKH